MQLRPYQTELLRKTVDAWRSGRRSLCWVEPTGSGKTVALAALIRQNPGMRVLFLCPWRELVRQGHKRLTEVGIDAGIMMGTKAPKGERVHVASIQTAVRRSLGAYDLVVVDEAHRAASASCQSILNQYPNARILGMTATPIRLDGKPLAAIFKGGFIETATPKLLMDQGYLVKSVVYAPRSGPQLGGLRVTAGDWETRGLSDRMGDPHLVGNAIAHWKRLGQDRRTFVYCCSVAHAQSVAARFRNAGIAADVIHASTPAKDRERMLSGVESGRLRVLCNVAVLTEGLDMPALGCMVILRPTLSLGLHLQIVGRGLRPYPGKHDCLYLDHADNFRRHGFPQDPRHWGRAAREQAQAGKKGKLPDLSPRAKVCPSCGAVWPLNEIRCRCGHKLYLEHQGTLDLLTPGVLEYSA